MERIAVPRTSEATREKNAGATIPEAWLVEWRARPPSEEWRCGARCHFCDKAIRDAGAAVYVRMTTAGELVTEDEPLEAGEDQGCFPVGPECARKVPPSYRIRLPESR